jgi:hypothetical protein
VAERSATLPGVKNASKNHHGGRPCIDWQQAFTYFAGLSPGERSYRVVAEHFDVSWTTVKKWAHRDRWEERAAQMDAEAAARVRHQQVRSLAERMETVIRLAEGTMARYAERLTAGDVRVTAQDVVALAKLQLVLEGRPDTRVETVFADLGRVSDEDLAEELERMRQLDSEDD